MVYLTPGMEAKTLSTKGGEEPMSNQLLIVHGNPRPMRRPLVKTYKPSKNGVKQRTYAYIPKVTRVWQQVVQEAVWGQGAKMIAGPLEVTLTFVRGDRHKVDLDNLCKAVLDAISGICYPDDSAVVKLKANLYQGSPNPGVVIYLRPLAISEANLPRDIFNLLKEKT